MQHQRNKRRTGELYRKVIRRRCWWRTDRLRKKRRRKTSHFSICMRLHPPPTQQTVLRRADPPSSRNKPSTLLNPTLFSVACGGVCRTIIIKSAPFPLSFPCISVLQLFFFRKEALRDGERYMSISNKIDRKEEGKQASNETKRNGTERAKWEI